MIINKYLIKKFIKWSLGSNFYYIYRSKIILKLFRKHYFGLNNLDRDLEKHLKTTKGFFVDVGANDGITQSNTKRLEIFKKWQGILIEPIPIQFKYCNKSRSSKTWNLACCALDNEAEEFTMIYSNLMTLNKVPTSELPDPLLHASHGAAIQKLKNYEFTIGAKSLDVILESSGAPLFIDFLNIDVEGSEMSVLAGINHTKWRFSKILIETSDFVKIEKYLKSYQYDFITALSFHDYLFGESKLYASSIEMPIPAPGYQ
jgi:FkbM family methyltransferase